MQTIILTQGKVAFVDDEDFEELNKHKWYVGARGYAIRHFKMVNGKRKGHIAMHRVIMDTPDGMEVDHRDGNRVNNQKYNLRNCTKMQNLHNQKRARNNKSGTRGVCFSNRDKIWMAYICVNNKLIYLGRFLKKEDAIKVRKEAEKKHYGEFA